MLVNPNAHGGITRLYFSPRSPHKLTQKSREFRGLPRGLLRSVSVFLLGAGFMRCQPFWLAPHER
ncbi:hypothetical protein [Mobiluncus mulieris]|uniref:hypothetical protein n=1 Tax=Mobiluncus mulieris TaxID=2052 RepID=UPI00146FF8E7|nr:hypothetical protein [Mobiluncus mulieris]NMW75668.1 hypothetical protein [Mobiluncus mulieris]